MFNSETAWGSLLSSLVRTQQLRYSAYDAGLTAHLPLHKLDAFVKLSGHLDGAFMVDANQLAEAPLASFEQHGTGLRNPACQRHSLWQVDRAQRSKRQAKPFVDLLHDRGSLRLALAG